MAAGDIKILKEASFGFAGTEKHQVASGTTKAIKNGEPVAKALGAAVVTALATSKPVVATDFMAGIALSDSTETASAAGTVEVIKLVPGVIYLGKANDTSLIDTQAKYDALVGDRVAFDLTGGSYTVLLTDGATNGLVVENLDITKYPNMVAFSIRNGVAYNA